MNYKGTPPAPEHYPTTVQSVEKTLSILEYLHARGYARITELAEETGFSKSTVHKHLATLVEHEYVIKEDELYMPSLRFLDFGGKMRANLPRHGEIKQKMRELADMTDEIAQFAVLEYGKTVTLYREVGRKGVFTKLRIGSRMPINQTAGGKAILSQLSEPDIRRIIETYGLPAATENTITDAETLFEEIETVRERGYAFNEEETIDGLVGVSVPIELQGDRGERILGACTVSGPRHRLAGTKLQEELPQHLLSTVNELELNITYS